MYGVLAFLLFDFQVNFLFPAALPFQILHVFESLAHAHEYVVDQMEASL